MIYRERCDQLILNTMIYNSSGAVSVISYWPRVTATVICTLISSVRDVGR